VITGPRGWLNWYAQRDGYERRTEAHPDSVSIRPIWEEYALYTDAQIQGGWVTMGPYELIVIDHRESTAVGQARRTLLLRSWDHIPDHGPPGREEYAPREDVDHYFGGDLGDEIAALIGLVLGCRMRSGGLVRQGLPIGDYPVGFADESQHRAPGLVPPNRAPLLSTVARPALLNDVPAQLETYPTLNGADAVALVRAARQYGDALWVADGDPRLAWVKLVSALEVAANHFDDGRQQTPEEQLRRHRSALYSKLVDHPDALEAVAQQFARMFNVERKVRKFVKQFDPGPPAARPGGVGWHFDWSALDSAIGVIYDHRSRDLHDGIAFPWPLCEPPFLAEDGVPAERFPAEGMSARGGQWTKAQLPMYLHVFEHVVGGALRRWWAEGLPRSES
jgi:hypothetical protein